MSTMKAVVNDPQAAERFVFTDVDAPRCDSSQALVRVRAVSLNRGEVRMAMASKQRYVPGWDLAGEVEQPAADGSGPKAGTRVVGWTPAGAWAELAAVHTRHLAELPEGVSFSQAATLPVAGLTALKAVSHGGNLLDHKVLVTGASGGVGVFAVELAHQSGGYVVGLTHHKEYQQTVREAGADQVVTGEDANAAEPYGRFHLVIDSVGGKVLASALTLMEPYGTAVTYGVTQSEEATIHTGTLYRSSTTLIGLFLLGDLRTEPAGPGLKTLAALVADGRLHPRIEVEAPLDQLGDVARRLMARQFSGKAVLLGL